MTDRFYIDVGYRSLVKHGQTLCGDHVEKMTRPDGSLVLVLADGLGSGVKACILSTLTSTIIARMMAENLPLRDFVKTIAAALPICSERHLAYSTFTILNIAPSGLADIIQYDNPGVMLIRGGREKPIPYAVSVVEDKQIESARIQLEPGDVLTAVSDGVVHSGVGRGARYPFGWGRDNAVRFLEGQSPFGFSAQTLNNLLLNECARLCAEMPGDDTTALTVCVRKRERVNLVIGPPDSVEDNDRMMAQFFAKKGRHVVCGGTTAQIASGYLKKPLSVLLDYEDPDIPAMGAIEGVDLVTEGVITMKRVLANAKSYLADGASCAEWVHRRDGASLVSLMLFEHADDVSFFVGRAVNPAHQRQGAAIGFDVKMQLVRELADCLKKMGKQVRVSYF